MKRKSLLSIYFLFIISTISYAIERPERIPDKLEELEPRGWYVEKARSWKEYIAENPGDKQGWIEYYKATSYSGADLIQITALANEISQRFPGSFEADYVQYKAAGWTEQGVGQLQQALRSQYITGDLLPDRILLAEYSQDGSQRSALSKELFEGKYLYPSLLNYSYNVLMSVGENGVLIVQGEPSSIPIWVLQDVMEVRNDIKVLNLDLAVNKRYLAKWLDNNKINEGGMMDSIDPLDLIGRLPDLNPDIDFYYGLTLPASQLSSIEERLYVVGLASLHRNKSFDHYGLIKENIENKFLIDYLTVDFNGEPKSATGRVYETNYILPFLLLKEYYDNLGDAASSGKWHDLILDLADRSQIKNRVAMLMEKQETETARSFTFVDINVKKLDEKLEKIKGNLYASAFELTNKEYWFYLDYLNKNGYTELYEKSLVDLSKYDDFTKSLLSNYHYSPVNAEVANNEKLKKENFLNYPAMDMTFEAAKGYCEWLSDEYNQQPDRRFKKVRFRLPTQNEWTMAALGYKEFTSWIYEENTIEAWEGRESNASIKKNKDKEYKKSFSLADYRIDYPWFWDIEYSGRIINNKGCYLANVKTPEDISCPIGIKGDGFVLMSPVGVYFPNGMGLFDVVGNVAEMLNEDGVAMGGSWNHEPEESTITSINHYTKSDASVGFRIFMEVIEE